MPADDLCYGDLAVSVIAHRDAHIARARAQARVNATAGFIATLPELLTWRMESDDEELHNGLCLLDSDEYHVRSPADGEQILLVLHGGGLFSNPTLVRQLGHAAWDGGVEIDEADSYYLQVGINHALPPFPTFSYNDFCRQEKLPRRYGVQIELERIASLANGFLPLRRFEGHPLFIARCGGRSIAHAYLDYLAQHGHENIQFEFFDAAVQSPSGHILQSVGDANISPFFGDLSTMSDPHYLVAREKRFSLEGVTYRDAPKRV